ncbi:hypothetical protein GCM10009555_010870 [Acrocarpospora macrocephala]|uniref:N-acetylmuramoyl-L-alanine amidase n=1 Tax=Acrocarpospora macrocephala TaxID=150177 RepID=A0A5M3WZN7_9ACTN|nr:peptidoglycan recognition family protein [Acrocarpospora macrocephala]GES14975.1 hypothetical protein Amac_085720 [Acrocarpospora macrocephala]
MSVGRRSFLTIGGGLAGAVLLTAPAEASAAPAAIPRPPRIYLREEWEARPPKSKAVVLNRVPDKLIVHHTATLNHDETSLKAAFGLSRAIQRYHMRHNGWDDIGEQFTISRGGHVMEGRNRTMRAVRRWRHVVGAQAADHNRHTLGIETEGTYMDELPPQRAVDALLRLLTWLCWHYELEPDTAIIGHRDVNATSCPGDKLYELLPEIREKVTQRLDRGYQSYYRYRLTDWGPLPAPAHYFDHGPTVGPNDHIPDPHQPTPDTTQTHPPAADPPDATEAHSPTADSLDADGPQPPAASPPPTTDAPSAGEAQPPAAGPI